MAETYDESVVKAYYIFILLHKVFENPWFSKSSMKIYTRLLLILIIGGFLNNSMCACCCVACDGYVTFLS
jgi:hypothetical protein